MTNNDPSTPAQLSLDLENDLPSVLQFNVGVNDIGGTLVAELAINQGRVSCLLSDILALKQESSFIRYCWDVLKVSTVFLPGLWASPPLLFSAQILALK